MSGEKLYIFLCPECGETIERLYDPRGHYHGDPSDLENRRFVPAERVEVFPVSDLLRFAEQLETQILEGDGPSDLTAATVRAVKAQGIRDALAAGPENSHA